MSYSQASVKNLFSHKENVQLHVLCSVMKNRIMSQCHCTEIITQFLGSEISSGVQ